MAPDFQTHVPMIVWMSDTFENRFGIDEKCMADKRDDAFSHDNLFHSLLGMLDIKTEAHDAGLDIFSTCKVIKGMSEA